MNYSLTDIPNSGPNPMIYMDLTVNNKPQGRIYIKLFRDAFPAGVENFLEIAAGSTQRAGPVNPAMPCDLKVIPRTYVDSKFYNFLFNNYLVGGDIYNNNGSNAGTIYNDQSIPFNAKNAVFYPHHKPGLISLIPYDESEDIGNTGNSEDCLMYDSTFMITLDAMPELDHGQIVIGEIYEGIEHIEKINSMIQPHAGRRYPDIRIADSGIHRRGIKPNALLNLKTKNATRFIQAPRLRRGANLVISEYVSC